MKYQFININRSLFPVKKMCLALDICESGYYRWLKKEPSPAKIKREQLKKLILKLYSEHNGMAGSPMITADLKEYPEFSNVSVNTVASLMKKIGIRCKTIKKFVVTTDSNHKKTASPNLLARKFKVSAPNQVWVSDITYLKIKNKWYYLSLFIDLYSRLIVSWDLSDSLKSDSVVKAFKKAIFLRSPDKDLMVHSDQGVQYASDDFRNVIKKYGFSQSMSRRGNCWDNAVAESFFHTLKTQLTHHVEFKTHDEAEINLFKYIEAYYNRRRKHSTNQWKTPAQYEMEWYQFKKVA